MRPRDNQKQRLYDAEGQACMKHGGRSKYVQTIANAEVQTWVDKVLDNRAVRNRWPNHSVQAVLKKGGSAYGYRDGAYLGSGKRHRITLPLFARNEWVILHEIAHCLTPSQYAPHGPEFAGVMMHLVKSVLGKDAATLLRAAYRDKRVRSNTKAVPKPKAVPTKAAVAAKAAAAKRRPPSPTELREAAEVIRQAAKAGLLGESARKPRVHALATARLLDKTAEDIPLLRSAVAAFQAGAR